MFGNEIEITSDVVEVFEEILERLENDSIENPGKPIVIELTRAENVVVDIYWEQFQEYTLEAFSDKWMPTRFIGDIIGKHYILLNLQTYQTFWQELARLLMILWKWHKKATCNICHGFSSSQQQIFLN